MPPYSEDVAETKRTQINLRVTEKEKRDIEAAARRLGINSTQLLLRAVWPYVEAYHPDFVKQPRSGEDG